MTEWKQIKRATRSEKAQMEQMAIDETICSFELFHRIWEDDCPYYFEVERHSGYQLQAYRIDNDEMADTSYSKLVARCGVCRNLMTIDGADFEFCAECQTEYDSDTRKISQESDR